ncbi:MAG: cytidine deaminase [Candidatus Fimenecus sp.]
MEDYELLKLAESVRINAYAPYSNFKVGTALLSKNGKVFTGVNIENTSYPVGICAERAAISKAISCGETKFVKIAISGFKENSEQRPCFPCGMCRQTLSEFCDKSFEIIVFDKTNRTKKYTLGELLTHAFKKER